MWNTEIRIMIREIRTGNEVPANPRNSFIENGFVHSLYCGYLAVIRLESEESPTSVIDEQESILLNTGRIKMPPSCNECPVKTCRIDDTYGSVICHATLFRHYCSAR